MKCQLIQTDKLNDDNRGEREVLACLSNLPDGFYVYRELKVSPAFRQRMRGYQEVRPDFVVLAPTVGLVSIEVKDWNFTTNTYHWRDQQKIEVTRRDGSVGMLDNPAEQVDSYLHAFTDLVREAGGNVWVTSLLAFPRVSRHQFLNAIENPQALTNPNSRFLLDLDRTLFKEDFDQFFNSPEDMLKARVERHQWFRPSLLDDIENVAGYILPDLFRIGDLGKRQKHQGKLRVLSQQQSDWVFGLDRDMNHLLDVAGSGKTSALVAKAIHLVSSSKSPPPHVLLTTYNQNLERNIRRIYDQKLTPESRSRFDSAITIRCLPLLLENIVTDYYQLADISVYRQPGETPEGYEQRLRTDVEEILEENEERYAVYDAVFLDEIQDFDDFFVAVVRTLCRGNSFFFVGDIGQKIYERSYDLRRHGIVVHDINLPKSYRMYRTPRYIGQLAVEFIQGDRNAWAEFEAHGYRQDFEFPNSLDNAAEVLASRAPEADAAARVDELLRGSYTEDDIMVVTSHERLDAAGRALEALSVIYTQGESGRGGAVTLVDFMNVKGLERPVVIVTGIEDLYNRSQRRSPFGQPADVETEILRERLSRRKIYVALTRPTEQLMIYYTDHGNRFVSELVSLNQRLMTLRLSASA